MKSCISTYSFERLYQDGGFTRFNAIDKTKEYGCQGVELVLNDETPDGSTPMEPDIYPSGIGIPCQLSNLFPCDHAVSLRSRCLRSVPAAPADGCDAA